MVPGEMILFACMKPSKVIIYTIIGKNPENPVFFAYNYRQPVFDFG